MTSGPPEVDHAHRSMGTGPAFRSQSSLPLPRAPLSLSTVASVCLALTRHSRAWLSSNPWREACPPNHHDDNVDSHNLCREAGPPHHHDDKVDSLNRRYFVCLSIIGQVDGDALSRGSSSSGGLPESQHLSKIGKDGSRQKQVESDRNLASVRNWRRSVRQLPRKGHW